MRGDREKPRSNFKGDKTCQLRFSSEDSWQDAIIKNISTSGLGIIGLSTSFFEGDKLQIRFNLCGKDIYCTGRVSNINGRHCGISFIKINEDDSKIIESFI